MNIELDLGWTSSVELWLVTLFVWRHLFLDDDISHLCFRYKRVINHFHFSLTRVVYFMFSSMNAIRLFWYNFNYRCGGKSSRTFLHFVYKLALPWLKVTNNPKGCMSCDQNQQVGEKVEEKLFYLSLSSTWLMDKRILVHCSITQRWWCKKYCHLFCLS